MENEEQQKETNLSYFAVDGNYGNADGIVIVDTASWTEDDWQVIDEAGDRDRASVALALAKLDEVAREAFKESILEGDLDRQFDKRVERE